jgi:hypothetical protein
MLSNKVNSRDSVIVTDAELSIVKVAQLERVFYYNKDTVPTKQSMLSRRSAAWRIESTSCSVMVVCLLLLALSRVLSNGDGFRIDQDNVRHTEMCYNKVLQEHCDSKMHIYIREFQSDDVLRLCDRTRSQLGVLPNNLTT